jgi:hypothetical protein
MTHLAGGAIVTDIDSEDDNARLTHAGYTIRHIETWHDHDTTCILWDAPAVTEADLPF